MAAKQQEKQTSNTEKTSRPPIATVIGKNVIRALGQPANLIRVQVRTLWGDYVRANVLVGPDTSSVKIAHSYFLSVDEGGNIVSAVPEIERKYH